ncbi:hypothetical protein LBK6_13200 [Leptospira borgpetersenii serovar Hardjo]|nr:hypothetical protein LBK6_13200 [Leptospira borgpetersenii serovar Hardjo]AWV70989.1 hypothetical protein B9T54_14130 [Leptospira borgpetersenii serovar Hardjo-bovis]AMX62480.1 hypothetical protein LBK9_13110 [Leptospira borgpetersenii serovar Hardjo]AMX65722.1 hypothetical protein LBK30_13125 [Leptospira borgpetersenii serovar Hardjo]AMX68955.1 hypothetical protein LBHA_13080 [Leptospira borgpetersenii serovar Hardjo]
MKKQGKKNRKNFLHRRALYYLFFLKYLFSYFRHFASFEVLASFEGDLKLMRKKTIVKKNISNPGKTKYIK